jgi:pimeloyl-ACP methyl ester carboxylesterase
MLEQPVRQSIRLTKSADGTTIAWADAGSGPALVKAANWLTHLEHDTESPVWRHWIRFFAEHYRFVRYDERGCGMSEREPPELSLDRSVDDLAAVIEAAQPAAPFALLGISQGGAAAIRYAVAHFAPYSLRVFRVGPS